jgi:hypothetical protein
MFRDDTHGDVPMITSEPRMAEWLRLIRAEYAESPGMALTKPQVQRLWGSTRRPATRCSIDWSPTAICVAPARSDTSAPTVGDGRRCHGLS